MVQVVLIHPGTTDFDDQDRIQGTLDVPLNARGQGEVEVAARELRHVPFDAMYCGGGEPSVTTAAKIASVVGCRVKKVKELSNANLGLWQGLRHEEMRRKHPKVYRMWQDSPRSVCPPGGETLGEVDARAKKALQQIVKRHRKDRFIGIVASEPMASLIRCFFLGCEIGEFWENTKARGGEWEVFDVSEEPAPETAAHK